MITELSENEFKDTFGSKMTDVTETAYAVIDVWDYVQKLVAQNLVEKYVLERKLVEKVYRNDTATFDHVLLPTTKKDVFMVLVIHIPNEILYGHFVLDLNSEYGIKEEK